MKSICLAAAAIVASSTIATAQEKVQISYSGVVSIESLSIDGASGYDFNERFYAGNGDVAFRWSTANDLNYGVDVGFETFGFLNDVFSYDISAYYAAGVVEGGFGRVSIGMPRGVMSDYFEVPSFGGSKLFDTELVLFGSDFYRLFKLYFSDEDGDLYGARYDGKIGQVEVAASVSKFSDYSGSVEELVARYKPGLWTITLGTSFYDFQEASGNSVSLEIQRKVGKLSGGAVFNKSIDALIFDMDSIRAFVSYDLNDSITLNTQVWHLQGDDGPDQNSYAFDVAYKHKSGAFINAGVITGDSFSDKAFDVSVGYKF